MDFLPNIVVPEYGLPVESLSHIYQPDSDRNRILPHWFHNWVGSPNPYKITAIDYLMDKDPQRWVWTIFLSVAIFIGSAFFGAIRRKGVRAACSVRHSDKHGIIGIGGKFNFPGLGLGIKLSIRDLFAGEREAPITAFYGCATFVTHRKKIIILVVGIFWSGKQFNPSAFCSKQ